MKKRKQIIISCSIAAMIFLLLLLRIQPLGEIEPTCEVFIFKYPVGAGSKLNGDMLQRVVLKGSLPFLNAVDNSQKWMNRYLCRDMENGQMLLNEDLYEGENRTFYQGVAPGHVLYSLSIQASAANGWWLSPGLTIDLYLYDTRLGSNLTNLHPTEKTGDGLPSPVRIIENIRLVRIMDEAGIPYRQSTKPPSMLCMEMLREDAMLLLEAEHSMKIKVVPVSEFIDEES